MTRVLVYAYDRVGRSMAGTAARAVAVARALGERFEVTLGLNHPADEVPHGLASCYPVRPRDLLGHDLVVAQTLPSKLLAPAIAGGMRLVLDAYDPFVFETLELHRGEPARERGRAERHARRRLATLLGVASHVAAANERQRDFYLGILCELGRLRPGDLSGATSVVPFGFEDAAPAGPGALKGVYPGIGADDRVLLWGGGVWNWFDPLTAIRGVAELGDEVKLFFLGTKSPNPEVVQHATLQRAHDEARARGLLDERVFFREGWVPHAERGAYFGDADLGISLHLPCLETRYASRTRLIDYLWAGLPVLSSEGDVLSEEIAAAGGGVALPCGDVEAFQEAARELLVDPAPARARVATLRERYRWSHTLAPLVEACARVAAGEGLDPTPRERAAALANLGGSVLARLL